MHRASTVLSRPLTFALLLATSLVACTGGDGDPIGGNDVPASDRDCSELGGGQRVVGERCLDEIVEYCIYSDTTQTATWAEIESCSAPSSCQESETRACCQSAEEFGQPCP